MQRPLLEASTTTPLSPPPSAPRSAVRPSLLPTAQGLTNDVEFYTNTAKQVTDVHEEALRIKETKKAAGHEETPAPAVEVATPATA